MLTADAEQVGGRIFNVGSAACVYQLGALGEIVARNVPHEVEIEWYGDPDHRSYRVNFARIETLGWRAKLTAEDGVGEICEALAAGRIDRTPRTITLEWYKQLSEWHKIVRETELYGGMLEL